MVYICVDFDGTICDQDFPKIGKPVPGAISWLKDWINLNAKIILFTMRSDTEKDGHVLTDAVNYLKDNNVELFGINKNPTQDSWTSSPKAYGHIYVDDLSIGCPLIRIKGFKKPCVDWSKVGPSIEKILRINQKNYDYFQLKKG